MKTICRLLPFLLILSMNSISNAQAPGWARVLQTASTGAQQANVITTDASYVYMAGGISGPVTFGGAGFTSVGYQDMIISKMLNSGTFVWTKQISAQPGSMIFPLAIAVDNTGNLYVAGVFKGSVTVGGSTVNYDAANNFYLAKFDPSGNGLWISSFLSTGMGASKIAPDGQGNVFLLNRSSSLMKFSGAGIKQWEQTYPESTLQAIAISGPDLFLGGTLQPGTTTFGGFNLMATSSNTAFLAKADLNGVYSKTLVENTPSFSTKDGEYFATGTRTHPTAGVLPINLIKIVSGNSENVLSTTVGELPATNGYVTLSINPDSTVSISGMVGVNPVYASGVNKYDYASKTFTLNYSYDGVGGPRVISEVLVKTAELSASPSAISDIAVNSSGDLILTGGFNKNFSLDTITVLNPALSNYTYVAKCNTNLEFAWIRSSGSFNIALLNSYSVFVDNSDLIYESAPVNKSFQYGSVTVPANPSNNGQFLVSFDQNGNAFNGLAIENNRIGRLAVSPAGKINICGSYDYVGAPNYGNLFVEQNLNNMSLEWREISSGSESGTLQLNSVKHDLAGNIYVQGKVLGFYNYFGTIINTSIYNTIIAKHDNTGKLLWLKQAPDISPAVFGTQFTLDKDNNVIMVGLFKSNLNLGTVNLSSSNSGYEGYVSKYSQNGELLWAAKMNLGVDVTENITVAADNNGNVIVTGVINPQNYLIKFNSSGSQLWAKVFPMESYYLSLVSTDPSNNIYLSSEIHLAAPATIGSVQLTQTTNDGSIALVKFDPNGNTLWAKTYGGVIGASSSDGWPCAIRNDGNGNTFLWGTFKNKAIIGASTLINPFGYDYSYFIAKINPAGGVLWAKPIYEKKIGFNYGDLLDLDKSGNAYIGGHFQDSISINGTIYKLSGTNDFFLAKYSATGVFQWIKMLPSNSFAIRGISVLKEDAVTITGYPGIEPSLGTKNIITSSGVTNIIASLGSLCYAKFDYTWSGPVNFTDQSIGDPTAWSWDFGDGNTSTLQNPSHIYTKDGTYNVTLNTINLLTNCVSSITRKVTAGPGTSCQADFVYAIDNLSGQTGFTSKSLNATGYYWNFGDGFFSTEVDPVHTYTKAGIYKTCLNISNSADGCQSSVCKDVIFIPAGENYIVADFSFYPDPASNAVTFNDMSTANTTDWYWTMGDGKIIREKSPVYTYSKPGIYKVCLTVFDKVNSLSQSVCKEVRVGSSPCIIGSAFSYFVDPVAREVKFQNQVKGFADSYFWTFGDGISSTLTDPVHNYLVPGYYKVTLAVRNSTNECMDKSVQEIQVGSIDCKAGFESMIDPDKNLVRFKDESKGNIEFYYWEFGDGTFSVLKDPEHTYKHGGMYKAGQTVIDYTHGCMDFALQPVQVGEVSCAADFITYIDSLNYVAYFTNRMLGESSFLVWSFGDGKFSTHENPVHKFPGPGIYSAGLNTYDMTTGCMDYYQENIVIGQMGKDCQAEFIYRVDPTTMDVTFNNKSMGDITGVVWNFGDLSDNSIENDPVHHFSKPGYYYVCLNVINSDGIRNMGCKWVLVDAADSETCYADFMFTVDSLNLKAKFVDNSFGTLTNYLWNFGDGSPDSASTLANPEHTYAVKGYYLVKLRVENSLTGCYSDAFKLLNVAENQVLKASFGYVAKNPDKKFTGYPVDLVSASSGDGATVEWDFGDKDLKGSFTVMDSTTGIVRHYYQLPGKYLVCIRITDPISDQTDEYCQMIRTQWGVGINEEAITDLSLDVYPNPFVDYTTISYNLPESGYIEIAIFDQLGRVVETVVKAMRGPGEYQNIWKTKNIAPGIYHLKLVTANSIITKQLVVSK